MTVLKHFAVFSILFLHITGLTFALSNQINNLLRLNLNDSVKSPKDLVKVQEIEILGNKTTNYKVILRELTFTENDSLNLLSLEKEIEQSKQNLLNTSLFNFVDFNYQIVYQNNIKVEILVEERWYFWPSLYFNHAERNFSAWWETKDMSKLDYGGGIKKYNFRGRNEKLGFNLRFGFTNMYELSYTNIALDQARKHMLGIYLGYRTNDQIPYEVENNQLQYFKTPRKTLLQRQSFNLAYQYRQEHHISHLTEITYYDYMVEDTVLSLNPYILGDSTNHIRFFTLRYIWDYDKRDFKYYPLKGYWFRIMARRYGLGFVSDNEVNFFETKLSAALFQPLSSRFYTANYIAYKHNWSNYHGFIFNYGLGFDDTMRGYELFVANGKQYGISKNTLKFVLLPTMVQDFKFIPFKQFRKVHLAIYLNAFVDMGYVKGNKISVSEYNNTMVDNLLYSYGLGIDFVTYYDKVLRIDYSMTKDGHSGFFIHFRAPIP